MKKRILVATRNLHKAREIGEILGMDCLTLNDVEGAPSVKEDADTFAGNAGLKAEGLARWMSEWGGAVESMKHGESVLVLADDSGLEVDALSGAPGVHSARFAAAEKGGEENCRDEDNNAKLLRLLADVPLAKRAARFRCVMALTKVGGGAGAVEYFDGTCEGRIEMGPRGEGGFGYDPLFVPRGYEQSFAELGAEEKNRISHRAKALEQLRVYLGSKLDGPH